MERGNIAELRAKIKKSQDKKRYEHTLGVTYTAACLAMCYDIDTERAEIAGLLHDCAKCLSNDKKAIDRDQYDRGEESVFASREGRCLSGGAQVWREG